MAPRAWRIGRIAGTEVRIDPSWAVIALLVGYSFFLIVAMAFPAASASVTSLWAVVATIAFFGSLLLHELAHAVTARARGIEVRGITLFLFGGATEADLDAERPADEFWISAVGPLASLGLAAGLWSLVTFGEWFIGPHAAFTLGRLGWLNLALALFNLLPGFPLDGGRVVRAAVWAATGDLDRSTRIAVRTGQIIGSLLIGLGLFQLLAGDLIGGLWTAAIGWFLTRAADGELRRHRLRRTLSGVRVADIMQSVPDPVRSSTPLLEVIHEHLLRAGASTVAVRDNGHVAGIVNRDSVRAIPRAAWDGKTAGDVMTDLASAPILAPERPILSALRDLRDGRGPALVIDDSGQVVGVISAETVVEWVERATAFGLAAERVP